MVADGGGRFSKEAIRAAKLAMLSDICFIRLNISGCTGSGLLEGLGVLDMIKDKHKQTNTLR